MSTTHEYRLHTQRGIIGPVKLDTVRDLADAGMLQPDTLVSRDGSPLLPVSALPELLPLVRPIGPKEGDPNYSGDIKVSSFMRILLRLYGGKATGVMVVRDATRRKDVFLEEGNPAFVTSTIGKERLGEFLIADNVLTPEQVRTALTVSQAQHEFLGVAIVRLGFLGQEAVCAALREQQLVRLVDLCGWEHGRYSFYDGARYEGERLDLQLGMPELWMRAARQLPERIILKRLGDVLQQSVVGFDSQVLDLCRAQFNGDERVVLSTFGDERSAVQVVTAESGNPARRRAVLTVLYLLSELGGLRFRASSSKSPVPSTNAAAR